jgi:serpin B
MRALAILALCGACNTKSPPPAPEPTKPEPVTPEPTTPEPTMPVAPIDATTATASNAFALDLWQQLRAKPGNLTVSPASISLALAMTAGGAKGATYDELAHALHYAGKDISASYGALSASLQPSGLTLRVANRLFGEKTFAFELAFVDKTKRAFGAPLESVDFKRAPDAARAQINTWVEKKTEKRIKDLLPPGSINPDTRMALVNAIYFLADWQVPFKKEATSPAPFSVTATEKKQVATMQQSSWFQLAKLPGGRLLELPYKGAAAAMYIALPDKADGLAELERTLDAKQLAAPGFNSTYVQLALPKFSIDPADALELRPLLAALGVKLAFSAEQADFTGIGTPPDPNNRLFISAVFHKAFVKVDEKGTEAAAATAVVMAEGAGMPPKPEAFIVDHPFLFVIVDKASGLILFMGRVADPS